MLIILFTVGTLMLGLVNREMTVEGETEVFATRARAWDTYLDTTYWARWKTNEARIEWLQGQRMEEGSSWRIVPSKSEPLEERISGWIQDSQLIFDGHVGPLAHQRIVTFELADGKSRIKEEVTWKASTFFENISLNFNKASLGKSIEIRLDSLKQWIDVESKEVEEVY